MDNQDKHHWGFRGFACLCLLSVWGGRWITTINTISANGVGTSLVRGPAGAETARGSLRGLEEDSDKDTLPSSFLRGRASGQVACIWLSGPG